MSCRARPALSSGSRDCDLLVMGRICGAALLSTAGQRHGTPRKPQTTAWHAAVRGWCRSEAIVGACAGNGSCVLLQCTVLGAHHAGACMKASESEVFHEEAVH